MTPILLKRYDKAIANQDQLVQQVVLEYWGNFSTLPLNVEILAAIDHQLQVNIQLYELPGLASIDRIKTIKLPYYESAISVK